MSDLREQDKIKLIILAILVAAGFFILAVALAEIEPVVDNYTIQVEAR